MLGTLVFRQLQEPKFFFQRRARFCFAGEARADRDAQIPLVTNDEVGIFKTVVTFLVPANAQAAKHWSWRLGWSCRGRIGVFDILDELRGNLLLLQ